MPILHVVVPVFNEPDTLEACLRKVVSVGLPQGWTMELRLVDDHSEPPSFAAAESLVAGLRGAGHSISIVRHGVNRGKGAALQTGFDAILAGGAADDDLVIIQDADLEYDPDDYPRLMAPIIGGETNAVLGSRWGEHARPGSLKRKVHAFGNRTLTAASNLMTRYDVSDMECCYKVMTVAVLRKLRPMLTEPRFGVEPQAVAGLARLGERIVEVPVRYEPRRFEAGKKIGWRDGVRAFYVIVRERLRGGSRVSRGDRTQEQTT